MNENKRLAIKRFFASSITASCWSSPLITSIALPVHAQTSECTSDNITGVWEFSISDGTPEVFNYNFDDYNVFFGGLLVFEIHTPLPDSVYTVEATYNNCTSMGGTFNNAAGVAGPESQIIYGTFTAKKIN